MLPSPDFSEQKAEERMRETAVLFVFVNLAVISYAIQDVIQYHWSK